MKPLALGFLFACVSAFGATVFDNGAPNAVNGNEMTRWLQAENFTLGSATSIEGIRFWAFLFGDSATYSGSIYWEIRSDSGGSPGSTLASDLVTITPINEGPVSFFGSNRLRFDINTGGVPLAAGDYWLVLHNGDLTNTVHSYMYWETTSPGLAPDGQEDVDPFSGAWLGNGQEHAFQLFDTPFGVSEIPEPSTWVLMSAGIGLLALSRRR